MCRGEARVAIVSRRAGRYRYRARPPLISAAGPGLFTFVLFWGGGGFGGGEGESCTGLLLLLLLLFIFGVLTGKEVS